MTTLESHDNPFRAPSVVQATAGWSPPRGWRLWSVLVVSAGVGLLCAVATVFGNFADVVSSWWDPLCGLIMMTVVSALAAGWVARASVLRFALLRVAVFQVVAWTVYLLGLAVLTGGELSRSDFEFVIPYVVGSLVAAVVVGAFVSRVRRSHQPVRPEVSPTQAQGGHVTGA